jgi:hypothetical protein
MNKNRTSLVALCGLLIFAASVGAQAPAAPGVAQPAEPMYWSMVMSVDVNAPVDQVWARVGKFCDIGEWMSAGVANTCKMLQGDGGPRSLRSVGTEVMAAATQYGYTYSAPPRANTP